MSRLPERKEFLSILNKDERRLLSHDEIKSSAAPGDTARHRSRHDDTKKG
jgi:hypothetical protein